MQHKPILQIFRAESIHSVSTKGYPLKRYSRTFKFECFYSRVILAEQIQLICIVSIKNLCIRYSGYCKMPDGLASFMIT